MEPEEPEVQGEREGIVEKVREEVELAKEGEVEETPLIVLGGLSVVLGVLVGVVIAVGLLVWWLA
jgi:hypothetical protein